MFEAGDRIVYGGNGVYTVEAVGDTPTHGDAARVYYTLTPLCGTGIVYVPVDTAIFMRKILTSGQVDALIARFPQIAQDEFYSPNQKQLADHYREALHAHGCEELVRVIKTAYLHDQQCEKTGKRPGQTEQKARKRAQELLYGEFSAALGIPVEDVEEYIRRRLEG